MTAQKSARADEAAGRTTKGSEVPMAEQTVTDLGAHGTITAEKFAVTCEYDNGGAVTHLADHDGRVIGATPGQIAREAAVAGSVIHDALEGWAKHREVPDLSKLDLQRRAKMQSLIKFLAHADGSAV